MTIALLVAAAAAHGQPSGQPSAGELRARTLYKNGERLYAEGEYEDAVAAFRQAYEASPHPSLRYDIANSHERQGRLDEAIIELRVYLDGAPADERPAIERRIDSLTRRRAKETAKLLVTAAPLVAVTAPAPTRRWTFHMTRRGWAYASIALVGVAAGAIPGGLALQARNAAECQTVGGATLCAQGSQRTLDNRLAYSVASDVSFGVALTSAVLFAALDFPWRRTFVVERAPVRVSLLPSATPQGGGVRVAFDF